MPNYQNSKIYKIISPSNPELVYYGSTTQNLSVRMAEHRRTKTNRSSKEILCFDDAIIILVENYPCNNKEELYKKESEYILNNVCVNKILSCRNNKQYYEDNKEIIKEKQKKYREDNKEMSKKYYEDNKEIIKEKRKKYYEDNKERLNERKKKYYEKNKEILKERRNKQTM